MKNQSAQRVWRLLLITLVVAPAAFAAPNIVLENKIEQRQVVIVDGKEQVSYQPAQTTAPGSRLRFTLSFRNTGDATAKDVVLNNPIPDGTTYLNGSATSSEGISTEFSIDGGKSYKKPALLTYDIGLPNGSRETRVASPEQYTHIRWRLTTITAGAAGAVFFDALVK